MSAPIKSILITGANAGLGKESARQFALIDSVERIYLGCRNPAKAEAAKAELEQATGRKVFQLVSIDVADVDSVAKAVDALPEPVDALVMNAGGMGGHVSVCMEPTKYGMTLINTVNLLGHAKLLDMLLAQQKLRKVAVYAGSEAAVGIDNLSMEPVKFRGEETVDEYKAVLDGSYFAKDEHYLVPYAFSKYVGTQWMASMSRAHPEVRLVTMSPGSTTGTEAGNNGGFLMKFMMKYLGFLLPYIGFMHTLDKGAKRYVDAVMDADRFKTGHFYASIKNAVGDVTCRDEGHPTLSNATFQDNANEALHSFIPKE